MAERKATIRKVNGRKPRKVVERNVRLLGHFMRYVLAHPEILDGLPANFELVILPDDDPAIRRYNFDLLSTYGSEGKPIVFVRMATSKRVDFERVRPDVYVPLAA